MLLDVNQLPLDVTQLNLWEHAACRWIQKEENQRDLWSKWIPVDTNCFVGYGLVDSAGTYVDTRGAAVRCEICPAGTFSEDAREVLKSGCWPRDSWLRGGFIGFRHVLEVY